ncbi:hypothetical protein GCM10010485_86110 [Streptosporangium carneum]
MPDGFRRSRLTAGVRGEGGVRPAPTSPVSTGEGGHGIEHDTHGTLGIRVDAVCRASMVERR